MMFSKKGFLDVRNLCCEYRHNHLKIAEELGFFDFNQEHFKDTVCLNIDEAERIEELLDGLVKLHNEGSISIRPDIFDDVVSFKDRIKKTKAIETTL